VCIILRNFHFNDAFNFCSQPNVEKWAELSSQLENAQGELLHSSRYHQTVSDWLDDARIRQKLETKTTKLPNVISLNVLPSFDL